MATGPQLPIQGQGPLGNEGDPVWVSPAPGSPGTAVTIADGADVALGARADAAASADTGTFSLIAILKRFLAKFTSAIAHTGSSINPGPTTTIVGSLLYGDFNYAFNGWWPISVSPIDGRPIPARTAIVAASANYLLDAALFTTLPQSSFRNDAAGNLGNSNDQSYVAAVGNFLVKPSHASGIERARTPDTFKSAIAAAAGNTPLWTPAVGKKFRLMRLVVEVTGDCFLTAGVPGVLTINLFDGAAGNINQTFSVYLPGAIPAAPLGVVYQSSWETLDNGILSALANNVLNINLSAAITAVVGGGVRVRCCGTEE